MPDFKKYVETGGQYCPYCNGKQIEGGSVDIQDAGAVQEVSCLECEATWEDFYKLTEAWEIDES